MDLSIIKSTTRQIGRTIGRNSPTILTGLGVAGLVSTVVLAVRGTIKAQEILYQESDFRFKEWEKQTGEHSSAYPDSVFTREEIVKLIWKCYVPTVGVGAVTIACMVGANSINLRRNAALASLYSLTETALKEYQSKVVERIGATKEEKIRGEIAQDTLNANPVDNKAVIITGKGDMLCYDKLSGRYFKSDIETIRRIQNDFNKELLSDMSKSLNELYFEMGLEPNDLGEKMGWLAEKQMLEFVFSAKLSTDNQPCVVIDHKNPPTTLWS